jgi:antitoxin YefM
MNTISYTSLRSNLAQTMEQVCDNHQPIIVTRTKAKPTVLISLEDYESIIETNYLLKSPTNAARLRTSIAEIEGIISKKKK